MPPRSVTLGILVFWVATAAWLVHRDILPRWRTDEPPPFAIGVADEVRTTSPRWNVFLGKKRYGSSESKVERETDQDHTFSYKNTFKIAPAPDPNGPARDPEL